MDYTYADLRQALRITSGTVTVAKTSLPDSPKIPDIDAVLDSCYAGQPVVLSEAVLERDDASTATLVIKGKSAFLDHPGLLPVMATFKLRAGKVQMSLEYTLPAPGWKFSHSFRDLPKVVDWRQTFADPMSVPLDDLAFSKASFVVINDPPPKGEDGDDLQQGINFLGTMQMLGGVPPHGVAWVIKRAFNYSGDALPVTGTIRLQELQATALRPGQYPWSEGGRLIPPGILLQADLGLTLPLNNLTESPLSFNQVHFRIYSPTSTKWLTNNTTFAPVMAYTGTLSVPHANVSVALHGTALHELGADELLLTGHFEGASVANLARLGGFGGTRYDLLKSMGPFESLVTRLVQLELQSAAMAVSVQESGIEVTSASVMVGMPGLNWRPFGESFELVSIATRFDVPSPFLRQRPVDAFHPPRKDEIDVTLLGQCKILGKSFDFTATTRDAFTVGAQLAEGQTITLTELIQMYPADSVPRLGDNLVIDYLALAATPAGSAYTFAGRLKSEPKLEITRGFALSEVTVRLEKRADNVLGEIAAVLNIGGVDLALRAAKQQQGWLFEGKTRPGQTIEFYQLVRDKQVVPNLVIPSHSNFPSSLEIATAEVQMFSPTGKFDFTGAAKIANWTFPFGTTSFTVTALRGEMHLSGSDEASNNRAMLAGEFGFGDNLVGTARVQLGSIDTVVQVTLKEGDASQFRVDRVADQLSGASANQDAGERSQPQFAQLIPADLRTKLSQVAVSINLTKSVYLAEGSLEGFGWAYLLYHSTSSAPKEGEEEAGLPAKSAYVFAAGLGTQFKFGRLLSSLAPIDDVVTVKDAMLAVYSVDRTDRAGDLGKIKALVGDLVKNVAARWPLPDTAASDLAHERGLVLTATIELSTSLFNPVFQIGTGANSAAGLRLLAVIDRDNVGNSVFGVGLPDITLLGALKLTGVTVTFRPAKHSEFAVRGQLTVQNIFGKDYAFKGSLTLTAQLMTGELELWTPPGPKKEDLTISRPFQLPGIEINQLKIGVKKALTGAGATPTFAVLGHTRLGRPPTPGATDKRPDFAVKLGLANGKPALMSIALDNDLEVGGFLAQCFTGDARNWPSNLIELTFKAGSRVYYYDEVAGSDIWKNEPAAGSMPACTYERGFNVDARAELALGNSKIPFHFTFRSVRGVNSEPSGFTASGSLETPVQLWFIEFASASDQPDGNPYIGGPALYIEATDPKNAKFGLKVGVNFFGGALAIADVGVSRTLSGDTQVEGEIRGDKSLALIGKLSFQFVYTRKHDGSGQTLAIRNWPSFEIAEQLINLVAKIKELADTADGVGCGNLASYVVKQTLDTKYSVSPSVDTTGSEPKFSVTLTCSMYFAQHLVMAWNPVTVPIDVPKDTTLDSLGGALKNGIVNAAMEIVRALLQQPDKVAMFFALTFGEKGGAYAIDLLCRRIRIPQGGFRTIIPPTVPPLVNPFWIEFLKIGGFAALLGTGALAFLDLLRKLASDLKDKAGQGSDAPKEADKLETPAMTAVTLDGPAFTGSWTAVAYAGTYEFELIGPVPFQKQTGQIVGTTASVPVASGSLAAGPYAWRVRAVRGNLKSDWSGTKTLTLEKLVAPAVHLASVNITGKDCLEATWTPLAGGSWTHDLQLLCDGTPLDKQKPAPTTAALQVWALAGLAPGQYTVRLAVQGAPPKYIASDWSAASNPVVKLAAPVATKLAYTGAGGEDRVHLSWQWQGDAAEIAFDGRLVAQGNAAPAAPLNPTAAGVQFDATHFPVDTFRAETQAHAQPGSPNAATTAPSDWSPPSACQIAKLPQPKIVSVLGSAGITPLVAIAVESFVTGADVHYARLFYRGSHSNQVEMQASKHAALPLPDDYHGRAQLGARAAKRDGSAIASNWDKRDIVRLAPPTDATFTYDHRNERAVCRCTPPKPDVAITAALSYEIQLFAGAPLQPFGQPRIVTDTSGPSLPWIETGELPAGPVQAHVRTVAVQDPHLVRSTWCVAQPALRKLDKAVVTDVTYDPQLDRVRIQLVDAGPGITYAATCNKSASVSHVASKPAIECPNPFEVGTTGSRTVSARLQSDDPAVIDGDWQDADPAWKLTKLPSPANPVLVWDDKTAMLLVSFTPGDGMACRDVQLLANNAPFGDIQRAGPNTDVIPVVLDDHLPAGSIAVQVRSNSPIPRTIPGDWMRSGALDRPTYDLQPQLLYTVGEESIVVEWAASFTNVRLAAQLLSGQTKPVGVAVALDSPAPPTPIRAVLKFGDDLPPGEVRVRFRTMPVTASAMPGAWTASAQTLFRLFQANPYAEFQYVDGTMTIAMPLFASYPEPLPTAFDVSFVDVSFVPFPPKRTQTILPDRSRAVLTMKPEEFPPAVDGVKIWTVGEDNRAINGAAGVLGFPLRPVGRPAISRIGYASGKLTLAWNKIEIFFPLSQGVAPYNVKIDTGDGNVTVRGVEPVTSDSPQSLVVDLDVHKLDGLPAGVWHVSVQAVVTSGLQNPGSGPWSEPASVLVLDPPAGLVLDYESGKLSGSWTASPSTVPQTYELYLTSAVLPQPLLWTGLDKTSVELYPSNLPEGVYTGRVCAVAGGYKTAWSSEATVAINPNLNPPTGLILSISPEFQLTKYSSELGNTISGRWTAAPSTLPQTYELEVTGGALQQPLVLTGLDTVSVERDVPRLSQGVYTGRVCAAVGGRKTAWSEEATTVINLNPGLPNALARLLHEAGTPAPRAVRVMRQEFPWIPATAIRTAMTEVGYAPSEVENVLAGWVTTYRKTEPTRGQFVTELMQAIPESSFDDLAAVKLLNLPLSEIIVYRKNDAHIGGIQACYGYGVERTELPLHGAPGPWPPESVQIPTDSPITRISGYATFNQGIRIGGLRFFTKGAEDPFKEIGRPYSLDNDYPFSFDAQPGEEVLAFFGAAYPGYSDQGVPFLGSLGVWMKHTG